MNSQDKDIKEPLLDGDNQTPDQQHQTEAQKHAKEHEMCGIMQNPGGLHVDDNLPAKLTKIYAASKDKDYYRYHKDIDPEEDKDDQLQPEQVFNNMVSDFSKLMLNSHQQTIKPFFSEPYEYKPEHKAFLPNQIRNCINPDNENEIDGHFTPIDKVQFFCKYEFVKGIKRGLYRDVDEDDENVDKDRHFLLVKTWQKVCFKALNQPIQQEEKSEDVKRVKSSDDTTEEDYFYVKTIQVFDDSINKIDEILVEMIPIAKEQTIDPYDTSTFRLSNKLFFLRRIFEQGYNAEMRLYSYDFSISMKKNSQRISDPTNQNDVYHDLKIEEMDEQDHKMDEQDHKIDEQHHKKRIQPHNSKDHVSNIHIHMNNVMFSEQFGQNEKCNHRFERLMEEQEAIIDDRQEQEQEEESKDKKKISISDQESDKLKEMREYKEKIEIQIIKEQYILTQSYHAEHEGIEKFAIISLKELLDEGFTDGIMSNYFNVLKQQMMFTKLEFGKIEQIFHIKNYQQQTQFVNFLIMEKDKISHYIINEWKDNEVQSEEPYFFDENYYTHQKMKQSVHIQIKNSHIQSYDENDQIQRIQQYYFVDQYNQIQLLFPLHRVKLQKLKIMDLIENKNKVQFKDPCLYKMVHRVSDIENDENDCQIFQSYQYLKLILPRIKDSINQEMQITYVQYGYHQILMINSLHKEELIFYTLRENDKFYHLCQGEKSLMSLRGKENINSYRQELNNSQKYVRRETFVNRSKFQKIKSGSQEKNHPAIQSLMRQNSKKKDDNDQIQQQYYNLNEQSNYNCGSSSSVDLDAPPIENQVELPCHKNINNKIKVQTHLDANQTFQINLLISQVVGESYQLVFSIKHKGYDSHDKYASKTYFFLSKAIIEIDVLDQDKKKQAPGFTKDQVKPSSIIDDKTELNVLRGIEKNSNKFRFESITFSKLKESFNVDCCHAKRDGKEKKDKKDNDDEYFNQKKIKLTYSQIRIHNQSMNFIAFVYQEADDHDKNNRLIIYDFTKETVVNSIIINPDNASKDYINVNHQDNSFKSYQITFSSDVETIEQFNGKSIKEGSVQIKLSLATFFQETYGRVQIQEFLIRNGPQIQQIIMVSIKQIFFSKELLQIYQQSGYINNSYIAPFVSDKVKKGIQLVWQKDRTEDEDDEQDGDDDEKFINLLDQDINNIYQYETEIACFGQRKFMLDLNNPEQYVVVISAALKRDLIDKNIFENIETVMILSIINEITAGIKMADLRYLMLDNFQSMKQKDFFKNQEIFQGKSFCDICLKDADEIGRAIQYQEEMDQQDLWPTGSIIYKLCGDDQHRLEIMKRTGFYKKEMKIQQDYNFKGTIQKAIEQNSFQTLKTLMRHILVDLNESVYQTLIMFNLKQLLECPKIEINEFFERTITERKNRNDEGFCNLEMAFKHPMLPEFSDKQFDYLKFPNKKTKTQDLHVWQEEIIEEISNKQKKFKSQKDDIQQDFEIEHSYIDFQQMIIGEKIRKYKYGSDHHYEFDDFKLCKLMQLNHESLDFYKGKTIQRIISYQWQTSKIIYMLTFWGYTLTFILPFYFSQMVEEKEKETRDMLLKICLLPISIMFVSEILELVTYLVDKKKKKVSIFKFYGIIFCPLFLLYAIPELMGVFTHIPYKQGWNPKEVLPELLFLIITLSFIRLLQFIRVYEEFGFFIDMFIRCLEDLETFIISFCAFLGFFTLCYMQLNVQGMQSTDHAQGTGYLEDMFFGTYRCAIQELSMPEYGDLNKPFKGQKTITNAVQINIYLIWIMYLFQAFLMAVVFLNFIIAVISSTYCRVYEYQEVLKYKRQASINDECFTLIDLFNKLFKRKSIFKVLVFSSSIEANIKQEDQFEEQIDQLKKFVSKQNRDVLKNHNIINKLFNELGSTQVSLENVTVQKFEELDQNQSKLSNSIIDSINHKDCKSKLSFNDRSAKLSFRKQFKNYFNQVIETIDHHKGGLHEECQHQEEKTYDADISEGLSEENQD